MENTTRAIAWLLNQPNVSEVQIQRLEWIHQLFLDWTDHSVSFQIELNGRKVSVRSWGAGPSQEISMVKAFSEASERTVFYAGKYGTSNGFAAHLSLKDASQNARNELLERHFFLSHFLTQTPFKHLPTAWQDWSWLKTVTAFAAELGFRLRYYQLGESGVLCSLDGLERSEPVGFVLGSSYNLNPEMAARSATVEAFRRAYFMAKNTSERQDCSLADFEKLDDPDFKDHGRLAFNVEYARQLVPLFGLQGEFLENSPTNTFAGDTAISAVAGASACIPAKFEVQTQELHWPGADSRSCPFFFARALSTQRQGLFVGITTEQTVNLPALSAFAGRTITLEKLNPLPHPFD